MSSIYPLLITKLSTPPPRPNLVSRPRLLARLGASGATGARLILVLAPAGFGKTTLLGEWVASASGPSSCWLTLDEEDNDPARFFSYLIAAIQTVWPQVGQTAQTLLQLPQSLEHLYGSVLPLLLNDLASSTGQLCLVLDDYHRIENDEVQRQLAFLLEQLPPNIQLAITSRVVPTLPLARLRARGQLLEIGPDELRFAPAEAEAFLTQTMGLGLDGEALRLLEQRTEGWVAGLQLAALGARGSADPATFIAALSGRHTYILDYLVSEIVDRQPAHIQQFLLRTSIVERLCSALCDALIADLAMPDAGGPEDSQEMLERLAQANLFLGPLDGERSWFRYHQLFAEVLRARLERQLPDEVAALHQRASRWFERQGALDEAFQHAVQARDWETAARLVEQHVIALVKAGALSTLRGWVRALPEQLLKDRPALRIAAAWALAVNLELDSAERHLPARGEEQPADNPEERRRQGNIAAIRALISIFRGEHERAVSLSRQALAWLPQDEDFLRGILTLDLALSLTIMGELGAAVPIYEEAIRLGELTDNLLLRVFATTQLGEVLVFQGRLRQAESVYRRAVQRFAGAGDPPSPLAGMALIGLGEVLRQRNKLDEAEAYLLQGIALSQLWQPIATLDAFIALARLHHGRGDGARARQALQHAAEQAEAFQSSQADDWLVAAFTARLAVQQGDLETAERLAHAYQRWAEAQENNSIHPFMLRELWELTLARLKLARGRQQASRAAWSELLAELATLRGYAERMGRTTTMIEVSLLEALIYQEQRQEGRALTALGAALRLAAQEGYARLVLDEGPSLRELLLKAAEQGPEPAFAACLLADLAPAPQPAPEGPDPLSERELTILRLMAAGLSNQAIARRLVVAESTVKWHINNLYAKLNVHNRTGAVARARALKLI